MAMVIPLLDSLLVVLILLNLFVLGTSRIRGVIQALAAQGLLLGLMPLLVHDSIGPRVIVVSLCTVSLKSVVIPGMLGRAMRDLSITREVEPLISLRVSMVLGALGTGLALAFAGWLPLSEIHLGTLLIPASLSTVWAGFLVLTTRRKAISQVLGYLLLENGVFIFGLLLLEPLPMMVEMGVLLDLFVGVFIMGIILNRISREFSDITPEAFKE